MARTVPLPEIELTLHLTRVRCRLVLPGRFCAAHEAKWRKASAKADAQVFWSFKTLVPTLPTAAIRRCRTTSQAAISGLFDAARDVLLGSDPMDSGGAILVVSEDGAGEHTAAVPPDLHIVQRSDESAHELKRRVLVALRRLRASGRPLSSAVVAAGQGSGDDVQAARLFIACALLRVMSGVPGATLVLAASSAETRHDLLGLADALLAELGTRGVRLRVATTRDSMLRAVRLPAPLRASA